MTRDDSFMNEPGGLASNRERIRGTSDGILVKLLRDIYDRDRADALVPRIGALAGKWGSLAPPRRRWVDESDTILITYGDSLNREGEPPLETLREFLARYIRGIVSSVHILPMYPYSSDDGFSVINPRTIDPALGSWRDMDRLAEDFDLMFDAVVNHLSVSSGEFRGFLADDPHFRDYFISRKAGADYSKAIRPRALPLFTSFIHGDQEKQVWTTFSADQADLNYRNPEVLLDALDLLCLYASRGARFIRLDAIGFVWKEPGSGCLNLPQAHAIVKIFRHVLDRVAPGLILITETNVPFAENIAYLGDGDDEANIVYQFPLPPLVLHSFLSANSGAISDWMESLGRATPSDSTTYLNFLASHDGIGLRPIEGLLSHDEIQNLVSGCIARGGFISYRHVGVSDRVPYELNINYLDALSPPGADDEERLALAVAAHGILLSVMGVPAIYIHSLLGSRNWTEGVLKSGINRRINREKLHVEQFVPEMEDPESLRGKVFRAIRHLIEVRRTIPAFHPNAAQRVRHLDRRLVCLERESRDGSSVVLIIVNISHETVTAGTGIVGKDLLNGGSRGPNIILKPYEVLWLDNGPSAMDAAGRRSTEVEA